MQFNSNANNQDLYSDAREWCGIAFTDTTSYPIANFTKNANLALDVITSWVLKSDGNWPWGDSNNTTDISIGYGDLISGQEDYGIPEEYLKIRRVRVKDINGDYKVVEPVNRRDLTDSEMNADAGMPKKYYQVENSIFLVPAPSSSVVTTDSGLEIEHQRGASYFTIADTTKEPGFASLYHRLVSMMGALDYCDQNDLEKRSAKLRSKIGAPPDYSRGIPGSGMAKEFVDFYASRDIDQGATLKTEQNDYGQIGLI